MNSIKSSRFTLHFAAEFIGEGIHLQGVKGQKDLPIVGLEHPEVVCLQDPGEVIDFMLIHINLPSRELYAVVDSVIFDQCRQKDQRQDQQNLQADGKAL